jgi:hypothetical protein
MRYKSDKTLGCGCFLLIIAFNLTVGALAFQYSLSTVFGKNIPWYGDVIAGLFLGEFTIPCAIVCWIITLCGVEAPFVR